MEVSTLPAMACRKKQKKIHKKIGSLKLQTATMTLMQISFNQEWFCFPLYNIIWKLGLPVAFQYSDNK